jgi:hypothetical protein
MDVYLRSISRHFFLSSTRVWVADQGLGATASGVALLAAHL